ncbi:hypothetical protein FB451DRAFT_1569649 [Mycena latifolia]|nr:hypothetical protein FB451DRAFT_1569649 [Mycena latifolia]
MANSPEESTVPGSVLAKQLRNVHDLVDSFFDETGALRPEPLERVARPPQTPTFGDLFPKLRENPVAWGPILDLPAVGGIPPELLSQLPPGCSLNFLEEEPPAIPPLLSMFFPDLPDLKPDLSNLPAGWSIGKGITDEMTEDDLVADFEAAGLLPRPDHNPNPPALLAEIDPRPSPQLHDLEGANINIAPPPHTAANQLAEADSEVSAR